MCASSAGFRSGAVEGPWSFGAGAGMTTCGANVSAFGTAGDGVAAAGTAVATGGVIAGTDAFGAAGAGAFAAATTGAGCTGTIGAICTTGGWLSTPTQASVLRQEVLERRRLRGVVGLAQCRVELRSRLDRRREGASRIQLQRAREPRAHARGKRLETASCRHGADPLHDFRNSRRVIVVPQRTPENQREGDGAKLCDVGAAIEARRAGTRRHRDAEILPVVLAREQQLSEGRSEHMLDDDGARVRRDDDPLERKRTVADVGHLLVQHGDRLNELANDTERRVNLDGQQLLLGDGEKFRQPHTFDAIGHDRERAARLVDAAHVAVGRVAEAREPAGAFAQGELEGRDGGQRLAERENLERLIAGVGRVMACAEAIFEHE